MVERTIAAWLGIVALGCSPSDAAESGSTGAGEPRVTVLVPVSQAVCDDPVVVRVTARALRVGCEDPLPSPCTLPAEPEHVLGDEKSCPITDPRLDLGVVIHEPGEYRIDALAERTPDAPTSECYATSSDQPTVRVTSEDLEVHAVKTGLVGLGMPCPAP